MGLWSVVIPEDAAQTNLVTNPSVETATTGYTAVGGTVGRASTNGDQRRGVYGVKVNPTSGVNDGVYYGTVSLTDGNLYYFSFDFKGTSGEPYQAYFANTSGTKQGTETTWTGTGDWQRISLSYTASGTAARRLYVLKNNDANTDSFYLDGLLVNTNSDSVLLDYFDGDCPGCSWTATRHASTSQTSLKERSIGYEVDLADYSLYIEEIDGVGMIPAEHRAQMLAGMAGAYYRGSKVQPRSFLLRGSLEGTSRADLHSNRKAIINLIKHDLVKSDQPFLLRNTHANTNKPLDIGVIADIEVGKLTAEFEYWQDLAVRLIAYDPHFYEVGSEAIGGAGVLLALNAIGINYLVSKIDGAWTDATTPSTVTDPGSGRRVSAILYQKSTGNLFVGGEFLNWDGDADADYIAYLTPSGTWTPMSTGADGEVIVLTEDQSGDIYAGGSFATTPDAYIAKWDISAGSWSALGSGMDASVTDIKIAPDGTLYACGAFSNAGGGAAAKIASWDGSTWSALAAGLNNAGQEMVIAPNGDVYVGGQFTTPANYTAKWNGSAWSALGTGMNGNVLALVAGPDGSIYAGGSFTTADGNSCAGVARWNGTTWEALGAGVTGGDVYTMAFDPDGNLWIGGDFTTAGGLTLSASIAMWNGFSWVHPDINTSTPGTDIVYAIEVFEDNIHIGWDGTGTLDVSYTNSVTNSGTARSYPKFTVTRTGGTAAKLLHLWNITTDKHLYFNYDLLLDEVLTVDCDERGRSITSNLFGSVPRALLRGSDFSDFYLLPGINKILVFSYGASTTPVAALEWPIRHESIDGTAA